MVKVPVASRAPQISGDRVFVGIGYAVPINTAKRFIDDLTVTHPIGFLWEDAYNRRGAKEIVEPTVMFIDDSETSKLTGAGAATFDTQASRTLSRTTNGANKTIKDALYGGWMTCATCHDVHNTKNSGEKFLWVSDRQSNMCLSCHLKGDEMKSGGAKVAR